MIKSKDDQSQMTNLVERAAHRLIVSYREIWPGEWPALPEAKKLAESVIAECFKWRSIEEGALPVKPGFHRLYSRDSSPHLYLDIPNPPEENEP